MNSAEPTTLALRNRQIAALHQAAVAIAGELSLDLVLQQIVEVTRELVGAQYAALGVPNELGRLETFVHSGMPTEMVRQMAHLPRGHGLLGAIIEERRTIRIPRIGDDPRSVGFPANHPPMDSFLGVPILAGEQSLGNLYMTNKLGADQFSLADQQAVEMLAAHAAVAIKNARLYEENGRLAIVEERTRIGMDLHDSTIQSIFAVGLQLEAAKVSLGGEGAKTAVLLGQAIDGLNATIRDIRNYILDLRPHRFDGALWAGVSKLVREFQANTMVAVTVEAEPEGLERVPPHLARTLFLTTQEALANVARHAKANSVTIRIDLEETAVVLTIQDDGQGFDQTQQSQSVGHGLSNMRRRADRQNGSFDLSTVPGQGTRISLSLPF